MYKVGDLLIYSTYGICRVVDICKKPSLQGERLCYVLRPISDTNLTINTPVDNDKVQMFDLIDRNTAERVLESFKLPGIRWIRDARKRNREYNALIETGNRFVIAGILNTLMRKEQELAQQRKKLHIQDRKLMIRIKKILFNELAMVLETTYHRIEQVVWALVDDAAGEDWFYLLIIDYK